MSTGRGRVNGTTRCEPKTGVGRLTELMKSYRQADYVFIQRDLDNYILGCVYAMDGGRRQPISSQRSQLGHMAIDNDNSMGWPQFPPQLFLIDP